MTAPRDRRNLRGPIASGRRSPRALPLLFLAALLLQCGGAPRPPDIVLIVVDTLRADHLGCYGYERDTSPAIDRLAAESILFERAYSTAPWTLPAFASILTGLYPHEHGASLDYFAVRESAPLLAEKLNEAGYETAAFVSHIYTSSRYGFDRGSDTFEEFGLAENYAFDQAKEPNAQRVITAAVDWLDNRDRGRPYFLTVHLFDPHWDYAAPPPFAGTLAGSSDSFAVDGSFASIRPFMDRADELPARDASHLKDLYDEEIRYTDAWIDTLLTHLRREEREPVIALTADHGEEFQEHGGLGHAYTFYDEVLRVPLILRLPDRNREGDVRSDWVTTAALYPTLLALAGIDTPGSRPPLTSADPPRALFAATNRDGRYGGAVLTESRKFVWDRDGSAVLDPARDPAEARRAPGEADAPLFESLAATATEGWTIRLPAQEEAVTGTVSVDGFILDVLPLTPLTSPVSASDNTRFSFTARANTECAWRFRAAPADAAVTFSFHERGRTVEPGRIRIGGSGMSPPSGRFTLDPARAPEGAFDPPDVPAGPSAISIDLISITNSPETIDLSPAERDRLRALGYF
ncbi:MAG: sulfatase [Gemmatimonadetes bacterium]|nr:sulfatase [Gemmatimonadota bacterium]